MHLDDFIELDQFYSRLEKFTPVKYVKTGINYNLKLVSCLTKTAYVNEQVILVIF